MNPASTSAPMIRCQCTVFLQKVAGRLKAELGPASKPMPGSACRTALELFAEAQDDLIVGEESVPVLVHPGEDGVFLVGKALCPIVQY